MTREKVDWEACEADYRAATFSNRALAAKYGCTEGAIRDRVKRYRWQKDLAAAVAARTAAKLLRVDLRNADDDAKVVEGASDVRATVVLDHRTDIRTGRIIVASLMAELQSATADIDAIKETIDIETADDRSPNRRAAMHKAVALPARAATIRELSQALRNLVGMERQAFNLDADAAPKSPLEGLSASELAALECALAADEDGDAGGGSAAP